MILNKKEIIEMIYETEDQREIMKDKFRDHSDEEFLEFAKKCFANITLISNNKFAI